MNSTNPTIYRDEFFFLNKILKNEEERKKNLIDLEKYFFNSKKKDFWKI